MRSFHCSNEKPSMHHSHCHSKWCDCRCHKERTMPRIRCMKCNKTIGKNRKTLYFCMLVCRECWEIMPTIKLNTNYLTKLRLSRTDVPQSINNSSLIIKT